jgi:hypothetical protein
MGTAGFASDLNCYTKIKLGWLSDKQYKVVKSTEIEKIVDINPLESTSAGL